MTTFESRHYYDDCNDAHGGAARFTRERLYDGNTDTETS